MITYICNQRLFKQLILAAALLCIGLPAAAQTGIVIMHGKGGSPNRHVRDLASGLESKNYLVANLEMPWSDRRDYDADVAKTEQEVTAALEALRSKGAKKVFVAGHSQGGVFALYYASKHPLDGVIAIAPGGSVASRIYLEKVGAVTARIIVATGKIGKVYLS